MRSRNASMRLHIHVVYIQYSMHCFAVVMARLVVSSRDALISMHDMSVVFSGIGAIFWLHQCQCCGTDMRDWPIPKIHIQTYKNSICSHRVSICKTLWVNAFYHVTRADDLMICHLHKRYIECSLVNVGPRLPIEWRNNIQNANRSAKLLKEGKWLFSFEDPACLSNHIHPHKPSKVLDSHPRNTFILWYSSGHNWTQSFHTASSYCNTDNCTNVMAKTIKTTSPVVTSIYIVENGRVLVLQFDKFGVLTYVLSNKKNFSTPSEKLVTRSNPRFSKFGWWDYKVIRKA